MVRKYGKPIDMRAIKRDIDDIRKLILESKRSADKLELCETTARYKCVICGSEKSSLFLTVYNKYNYFECENCGALILEKFPDVASMYASDNTENFDIYIDKTVYENRVNTIAKPKVDFIIKTLRKRGVKIQSWLDIGCGGGTSVLP